VGGLPLSVVDHPPTLHGLSDEGVGVGVPRARHWTQRERLRRLMPVQTRTATSNTNAAARTMSQDSSALRPPAMAWLMIRLGSAVVEVVESTGAR
jgi:hypothetical protein